METPIFSILIPYYKKDFIVQTLESVKNQYFTDYEIIIGNDSDDDYIFSLAERYGATCLDNPDKKSVGNFRNISNILAASRGEYIKILCDDDILTPFALQRFNAAFKADSSISLVFSNSYIIDNNNKILSIRDNLPKEGIYSGKELMKTCLQKCHNLFGEFSTIAFRRDSYVKHCKDVRDFFGMETFGISDFATAASLAYWGNVFYCKDVLSCFRRHAGSGTIKRPPVFLKNIRSWGQMGLTARERNILTDEEYLRMVRSLIIVYRRNSSDFPELLSDANELAARYGFSSIEDGSQQEKRAKQ